MSKPAPLSWFTSSTIRYTPLLIELGVISIVIRLLSLVQPFAFQTVIDKIIPFQNESSLIIIVIFLAGSSLFSALLNAITAYLTVDMSNKLVLELGTKLFRHLLALPLKSLERWRVGETLSRIAELDTIRNFLTGAVIGLTLDAIFSIVYVIALLSLSPKLTLISLSVLPLQIVISTISGPFIRKRLQNAFKAGAKHQSNLVEILSSPIFIKSLSAELYAYDRLKSSLSEGLLAEKRISNMHTVGVFTSSILDKFGSISLLFFGANLVFSNELTLGQLIAFQLIFGKVSGPIIGLSTIWEKWQGLKVARSRLGDLLNEPEEFSQISSSVPIKSAQIISCHNVGFSYDGITDIFSNISLTFSNENPTLVVGDSGVGKSTLLKVISGLYRPSNGDVYIDGININNIDLKSLRKKIVYVPQDASLFSGTVLENLKVCAEDVSSAEVEFVLHSVGAEFVFRDLPLGLESQVGERGGALSGGQRQRLALARAVLAYPSVLVLDEPTSALDPESERKVVDFLNRFAQDRTLIVVSHNDCLLGSTANVIRL